MEVTYVVILVVVLFVLGIIIGRIAPTEDVTNNELFNDLYSSKFHPIFIEDKAPESILKVRKMVGQLEFLVLKEQHETAYKHYEMISDECLKLAEEHKRSIQ